MPATATQPLTGTIRGVETFEAGTYPREKPTDIGTFTDAHLDAIQKNFQTLSAGDKPIHRVPVVVTHDAVHAHGWVEAARRNPDTGILETDWAEVSAALEAARKAGKLRKVSAEIKQDFTDNDGTVYPGPYLYRVAVIGADVPKVKGLADIPPAKFADAQPAEAVSRPLTFADPGVSAMDITAAVAYFAAKGVDTTGWDALPAEAQAPLIAAATAWQAEDASEGGTSMMSEPPPNPKKVVTTQHFSDRAARASIQRAEAAALKRIAEAEERAARAQEQRETEERVKGVMTFCDNMARANKLTPAENDATSPRSLRSRLVLAARQPQTVQTFSEGDREVKATLLELEMQAVEAREPMRFSERMKQPAGQQADPLAPLTERLTKHYAAQLDRLGKGRN
jgi:hypothetical protein